MIDIHYEGQLPYRYSVFNDSSFTKQSLTVGDFEEGNAGNFWNAPFTGRAIFTPSNTWCHRFYYEGMSSLLIDGLPSAQNL